MFLTRARPGSTCSAATAPSTSAAAQRGDRLGAGEPLQESVRRGRPQTLPPSPRGPHHRQGPGGGRECNIVVLGDLNEGPPVLDHRYNLATLFDPKGPLVDAYSLPTFVRGRGPVPSRTAASVTAWITSWSPTTWPEVAGGGIERHGLRGTLEERQPADPLGHLPADYRLPSRGLGPCRHLRRHQHLTHPRRRVGAQSRNQAPCATGTVHSSYRSDTRRVGAAATKRRATAAANRPFAATTPRSVDS